MKIKIFFYKIDNELFQKKDNNNSEILIHFFFFIKILNYLIIF